MPLPVIAIVGRPNVGKSSLFNALAGRRISIVEPTAGVTRDRVSTIVELADRYVELVDTGGYGIEDVDNLTSHVEEQIALAVGRAQAVIFLVDIRDGIRPLDQSVAQLLRPTNLPIILVANKADASNLEPHAGEFYALGFGEPLCVSAEQGRNLETLRDKLAQLVAHTEAGAPATPVMKLAVVGKRNAGKSTFINALAGESRMIVSEVPGTTRDSVDVRFQKDGQEFLAIDTAGVRKKKRTVQNSIEFYSYQRALTSISRADVVLFFIDSTVPIGQVDKQLASSIMEAAVPVVLVVNKWDLAKDQASTEDYGEYLTKILPWLDFAPISFITASEARNVHSLLDLARELHKQATTKVSTARINRALKAVTDERAPSARRKAGLPRIYYGTQVATQPPTLMLFVNNPDAIDENYRRFLINRLRDLLPFAEVPIRLLVRHHREPRNDAEEPKKRPARKHPPRKRGGPPGPGR
jgi:GTP-binding protein